MSDGWSWTFSSEWGRDNILRDRIDSLEASAAQAYSQSSRLRAQLARAQGSLEKRLTALSKAFDAYVELGDVRERLREFSGTAEVRRYAMRAIEALGQGRPPEPPPEDDHGYWLVPAVEAVVARAEGHPDLDAEARAVELDRDAETFVVVTLGMLGHGPPVADRVAALLVTDTGLDRAQQALWQAVLEGVYGPQALPPIGPALRPALRLTDGADQWRIWLAESAPGVNAEKTLAWLHAELAADRSGPAARPSGGAPPDGQPTAGAVDRLKSVAASLIAAGRSDERDLIRRAGELRELIENPDADRLEPDERERAEEVPVPTAVQQGILSAPTGSATRRELWSWLTDVLVPVAERLAADATPGRAQIRTTTPGGRVTVTSNGADPAEVQKLKQAAADIPPRNAQLVGLGATTGVLAVLTVALVVAGGTGWAIVALVGALIAGGVGANVWRNAREEQRVSAAHIAQIDQEIAEATKRAAENERENDLVAARVRALYAEVTEAIEGLRGARQSAEPVDVAPGTAH